MKLVKNISPDLFSRHWLLFSMALLLSFSSLFAEGLQKVAPTEDDSPVMLEQEDLTSEISLPLTAPKTAVFMLPSVI